MESLLYLVAVIVSVRGGVRYLRSVATTEEIRNGEGEARTWDTRKEVLSKVENAESEAFRARVNRGVGTLGARSPMKGIVVAFRSLESVIQAVKAWKDECGKLNDSAEFTRTTVTAALLPLSPESYRALEVLDPATVGDLKPIEIGKLSLILIADTVADLRKAWKAADVDGMKESAAALAGASAMVDKDTAEKIEQIRKDASKAAREFTKAVKDRGESPATLARMLSDDATSGVDALQFALIQSVEAFDAGEETRAAGSVGDDLAVQSVNVECNPVNDNAAVDTTPDLVVDDQTGTDD